jgi:D-amino-acid dehydrogenase
MKNIAIIGGGVVGLFCAYYLNQSGHRVTVFDKGDLLDNCSTGNAGMIVPSHIIPLAAPGMIAKGIRWMFNSKSPFYVKPRLNKDLIKWGLKFYSRSTKEHVAKSIPLLKEVSLFSKLLYEEVSMEGNFDFGYEEKGLLMLYHSKEIEKEERDAVDLARSSGLDAEILSLSEIQNMEPAVKVNARGGVYFRGDAHVIPQQLIENVIHHLERVGVTIQRHAEVSDFAVEKNLIKYLKVKASELAFDEYVISSGAWSGVIGSKLGIDIPMQGGKGYSFTIQNVNPNIRIPTLLLDGRVAVTPMKRDLRFAGTMEINGTDLSIDMNRVKGIVDTIPKFYPEFKVALPAQKEIWRGLRPCSPDGLPYIGRSKKIRNIIIATGHSMMGVSLAPATGKLVSELVDDKPTSMNVAGFNPERFSGS